MQAFTPTINLTKTNQPSRIYLDLPSQCPHCGVAYGDEALRSFISNYDAYSVYFCPHCNQCFFIHYTLLFQPNTEPYGTIKETFPHFQPRKKFADKISSLSPKFIEIYFQAEKAENFGLSEICGLGYRKALEFLIKDFAIHKNPEAEESIKSTPLSQCIKNYISGDNIKILAERSAWIGNDEAHYVRKQDSYNTSHMKSFIEACVYFIAMTLVTEEASSMIGK